MFNLKLGTKLGVEVHDSGGCAAQNPTTFFFSTPYVNTTNERTSFFPSPSLLPVDDGYMRFLNEIKCVARLSASRKTSL